MAAADIHVVPAVNEGAVESEDGSDRVMYFIEADAVMAGYERAKKRDKVELLIL